MRRISAVTLDLWDTLIQEVPGGSEEVASVRIEGIRRYLDGRGISHTREEIAAAYANTADFLKLLWNKNRDMPVRDQVLFLLASVDSRLLGRLSPLDLAALEDIYCRGILLHPPVLLPGAADLLKALRSKRLRIGLISNTGRTPGSILRTVMDNMGILSYFDTTTFSNEALIRKPDEGIFALTLDRLKVNPTAAVHIGDDAINDVLGARSAGMHTIHVIGNGEKPSDIADAHARSLSEVVDRIDEL